MTLPAALVGCDPRTHAEELARLRVMFRLRGRRPQLDVGRLRADAEALARRFPPPPTIRIHRFTGPPPGEWVTGPAGMPDPLAAAVVYLHGGGYVSGGPATHGGIAADIATSSGLPVLLADYRLAPEHPFPAAVDDAVAALRRLRTLGVPPAATVIGGDSAGGGLAIAALLALRAAGEPLPAGVFCLSPWTDLTCTGASLDANAARDLVLDPAAVRRMAATYLAGADARDPLASPRWADLTGLPPLLIQVGDEEILRDDAISLADRAAAAGVAVDLEMWPGVPHVWHAYAPLLTAGRTAIERIAAWVTTRVGERRATAAPA